MNPQEELHRIRKVINRYRFYQGSVFVVSTVGSMIMLFTMDPLAFIISFAFLWGISIIAMLYISKQIKNAHLILERTAPYVHQPPVPVYQVMDPIPGYYNAPLQDPYTAQPYKQANDV
jgi:hypothetical protein